MALANSISSALRRVPTAPLYVLALVPAALDFRAAFTNSLGADPVRALEQNLGLTELQLLIAALAVTPLRTWTGVNLLRFRRMLGLSAFFYAVLHVAVWLVLDRQLRWTEIVADLTRRPYIIVGALAFLLLLPLAATSSAAAIRRLGGTAWRRLHRLAYPATLLAAVHYVWLVKAWPPKPLLYAAGVLLLLAVRLFPSRRPTLAPLPRAAGKTGPEKNLT